MGPAFYQMHKNIVITSLWFLTDTCYISQQLTALKSVGYSNHTCKNRNQISRKSMQANCHLSTGIICLGKICQFCFNFSHQSSYQKNRDTMFAVVNTYTRASQFKDLTAENSYQLQRVATNPARRSTYNHVAFSAISISALLRSSLHIL